MAVVINDFEVVPERRHRRRQPPVRQRRSRPRQEKGKELTSAMFSAIGTSELNVSARTDIDA